MSRILLNSLFLLIFLSNSVFGQQLDHKLGGILILTELRTEVADFQLLTLNNSSFKLSKLKTPFHLYILHFDHNSINEYRLLETIKQMDFVVHAQFNFIVEERQLPDDPLFGEQWSLLNYGQNGGQPDADTDADLAWNISTGGLTAQGDTVVLCIIDAGFDITHPDLADNFWINHQEIPQNGIDDDGNGYVDDYRGWNTILKNDDINGTSANAWHGTPVAGVAAARGNNNLGIAGVGWTLKIMPVIHQNTIAGILEAYAYPYEMRKMYRQSAGAKGSFVVATNSSFGINYGQPSDAPLWCAIFDSLGQEGIINVAATANLNINVDDFGDLPTTCQSEFLISVTSTDRQDNKALNGAFGVTNIDIAAPGKEVISTLKNEEYGIVNGTSFAAPHVAATAALLYTTDCPSFIALAKSAPASAALLCRQYVISGGDQTAQLQGFVAQAKRLNIFKSLQLLQDNCNYSNCYDAYFVNIDELNSTSVSVKWDIGISVSSSRLRYRKVGSVSWKNIDPAASPEVLNGLENCSDYELQLLTACDGITNPWSGSYYFESGGCCNVPTDFTITNTTGNVLEVHWPAVDIAVAYFFGYRKLGAPQWQNDTTIIPQLLLENLENCTDYEYRLGVLCPLDSVPVFGAIETFSTYGCDNCIEGQYCNAAGPSSNNTAWISSFQLADIQNTSSNEHKGYSDFTNISTALNRGFSYPVRIESTNQLNLANTIFTIWIDYNQDGDFGDPNELALYNSGEFPVANGNILLPADVPLGATRLRVSARNGSFVPCGVSDILGEVEDYCVDISDPDECTYPRNIVAKVLGNFVLLNWQKQVHSDSYVIRYRALGNEVWQQLNSEQPSLQISDLDYCTDYIYQLQSVCQGEESGFGPADHFITSGCGNCVDYSYCNVSANSNFEWIEKITLTGEESLTGNNQGYLSQTATVFNIFPNANCELLIEPGWVNNPAEEYYMAWLDWNQDGDFNDAGELAFDIGQASNAAQIFANIFVPPTALPGSTKMRIAMKQGSAIAAACDQAYFGEIEDHCVNVIPDPQQLCSFSPQLDWSSEMTSLHFSWQSYNQAEAYSIRYAVAQQNPLNWQEFYQNNENCTISDLQICTEYLVQIRPVCSYGIGSYGPVFKLTTACTTNATEPTGLTKIQVFPNPFNECLNISIGQTTAKNMSVYILDIYGRQVYSLAKFPLHPAQTLIVLDREMPGGVYFIFMEVDGGQIVQKVVKE